MEPKKKRENKRRKKLDRLQSKKERKHVIVQRERFPVLSIASYDPIPSELVKEVNDAMKCLIDSSEMPRSLRANLEGMKVREKEFTAAECSELSRELGQLLYDKLGRTAQSRERIGYRIEVSVGQPNSYTITIYLLALEVIGRKLDPYFCSPRHPTVVVDGKQLIVAYRFHTLERIAERVVYDPNEYDSRSAAFAFPYYCKYFEPATLGNGQPCFKLWQWCDPKTFLGPLHRELLGAGAQVTVRNGFPQFEIDGQICCYLIGYCPIRLNLDLPEYVVLDSLWLPGMDHTPEFRAYVKKHNLDTAGRYRFSKQVGENLTYVGLVHNREFDLIREFHSYMPQVRAISEPVFDY